MQRGARSSFAPSTVRECTFVHDQTGTGARLEIARDAPPQFEQLSQKNGTITKIGDNVKQVVFFFYLQSRKLEYIKLDR